jgi:hypothetical protein
MWIDGIGEPAQAWRILRQLGWSSQRPTGRANPLRAQRVSVACLCNLRDTNPRAVSRKISDIYLRNEFQRPLSQAVGTPGDFGSVRFKRDSQGRVSGFVLNTNRVRNFAFSVLGDQEACQR